MRIALIGVVDADQIHKRREAGQQLLKAKLRKLTMKQRSKFFFTIIFFAFSNLSFSQVDQSKGSFEDKFRQLDEVFPSPNLSRPATGEPGPDPVHQWRVYLNLEKERPHLIV